MDSLPSEAYDQPQTGEVMLSQQHAPKAASQKHGGAKQIAQGSGDEEVTELHDTLGNQWMNAQLQTPGTEGPQPLADPTQGTSEEQLQAWLAVAQAGADDLAVGTGADAVDLGGLLESGQPVVLGLRGLGYDPATGAFDADTHETTMTRDYDDSFVVLRRDADGNPVVEVMQGSTHPTWERNSQSPDADRDGRHDAGMIRPGVFDVHDRRTHHSSVAGDTPAYQVDRHGGGAHADRLPAWRDTEDEVSGQSNNTFTEEERRASEGRMAEVERDRAAREARGERVGSLDRELAQRQVDPELGDWADAVLFHAGEDVRDKGTGATSIACQTMHPDTFRTFMTALGEDTDRVWPEGGAPRRTTQDFTYVLTEAPALLEAHPELRAMLGPRGE